MVSYSLDRSGFLLAYPVTSLASHKSIILIFDIYSLLNIYIYLRAEVPGRLSQQHAKTECLAQPLLRCRRAVHDVPERHQECQDLNNRQSALHTLVKSKKL